MVAVIVPKKRGGRPSYFEAIDNISENQIGKLYEPVLKRMYLFTGWGVNVMLLVYLAETSPLENKRGLCFVAWIRGLNKYLP